MDDWDQAVDTSYLFWRTLRRAQSPSFTAPSCIPSLDSDSLDSVRLVHSLGRLGEEHRSFILQFFGASLLHKMHLFWVGRPKLTDDFEMRKAYFQFFMPPFPLVAILE